MLKKKRRAVSIFINWNWIEINIFIISEHPFDDSIRINHCVSLQTWMEEENWISLIDLNRGDFYWKQPNLREKGTSSKQGSPFSSLHYYYQPASIYKYQKMRGERVFFTKSLKFRGEQDMKIHFSTYLERENLNNFSLKIFGDVDFWQVLDRWRPFWPVWLRSLYLTNNAPLQRCGDWIMHWLKWVSLWIVC